MGLSVLLMFNVGVIMSCNHDVMYYYIRYHTCDGYIEQYEEGRLQTQPGCSAEETLEVGVAVTGALIGQYICRL